MEQGMYPEDKIKEELAEAITRLEQHQKEAESRGRVARLRAESPRHPLLMARALSFWGSGVMFVVGLVSLVLLSSSESIARSVVNIPGVSVLPVGMVLLSVCGAILSGALFGMVLVRGASSPLLPRDLAQQSRLRSDVQRLKAMLSVEKKLKNTPRPAPHRSLYS